MPISTPTDHPVQTVRRTVRGLGVLLSLSLATGIFATAQPAEAADRTTAHKPAVAGYTDTTQPTKNFSGSSDLAFSRTQFRTYLKYDTSALDSRSTVVSASIKMAVTTTKATQPGIEVRKSPTTFTSTGLTQATQPTASTTVLNQGDTVVPRAGTTVTVKLPKLTGQTVGSALGFQLAYAVAGVPVRISNVTPPVLQLVTSTPSTTTGTVTTTSSTNLPYSQPAVARR